ncbi:hypothetical protein BDL97_05G070600 [Sphagnum fallax]|nr:hypothetical protein BDL97_05G070600 [Sphagnum fallax]
MGRGGDGGLLPSEAPEVLPDVAVATAAVEEQSVNLKKKHKSLMATDFFWSETDEPHATRRKQILAAHPEIRDLFGPDPWALPQIVAVVLLQTWTASCMQEVGWPILLALSYCFGAILNHNLFLAIHELSHNLAFSTPIYNRFLGLFANLPISIPMSITFQKYHLEHHRFQGVEGFDMDIPSYAEGHVVTNIFMKVLWVICQLFFYALRPLFLNPKTPGLWEVSNFVTQIGYDVALVYFFGWKSLVYLVLSTFLGGGLHPVAGHFIAEHYVFMEGQETYSYYGPLNLVTWNVGYHVEHHDFPRIPGCKLYRVRQIAPEFYDHLASHSSWTHVIYKYITDPTVGPFSRTVRKSNVIAKTD